VTETRKQHGLHALKARVSARGMHALDRRSRASRALAQWRRELIEDLGGIGAITTQEATLVEMAARTKLLLDSVDAWLLQQPSLINRRKKSLYPVLVH
jgi:hypothetical protein